MQALGILGGSDSVIRDGDGRWGYFFMAIDPELLMPLHEFKTKISNLQEQIADSRPMPGGGPVRTPGSAAANRVREGRERGWIEVDESIYQAITKHRMG